MRHRLVFGSLLLLALFLALAPTALASSKWYVDGIHGKNKNDCKSPQTACRTIGHAISLASSGDSIMVAAAEYTESLNIRFNLEIVGSGAATTIIIAPCQPCPVVATAGTHVSLSRMTIAEGTNGGVLNSGTLTINECTITHNVAQRHYGVSFGGGIWNIGTVTINRSTISANGASFGGGIYSRGMVTINRSTLSRNTGALGAGAFSQFGAPLAIVNSTVSGNIGDQGAGIAGTAVLSNSTVTGNSADYGGGINGALTLRNSIVANNEGGNCYNSTITSKGYNLSSDSTCGLSKTGDLNNTDPKLGQLGNYGGPTETMPLLSGSPAIDAGNPNGCTDGQGHLLKTDQRGKSRPDKKSGRCDMGAYERQKD